MPSSSAFVRNVSSSTHVAVGVSRGARPTERVLSLILANGLLAGTFFSSARCARTLPAGMRPCHHTLLTNCVKAAVDRAASDGRHWPRLQLRRGARRFAAQRPSPPRRRNDPSRLDPRAKRDRKRRGPQIRPQLSLILPGLLMASRIRHRPLGK
jgi:hypothetical protein